MNVETGERLNIAFGEDSYQINNNGDDMMWNPNDIITEQTYRYAFGGRHYIYVFGNNRSGSTYNHAFAPAGIKGKLIGSGTYANFHDFAYTYKWAYQTSINGANNNVKNGGAVALNNFWSDAMWTSMPVTIDPRYNFKNPADMSCDARVSLRVKKAYSPGYASNTKIDSSLYTAAGVVNASGINLGLNTAPTVRPYFGSGAVTVNANLKVTTRLAAAPVNNNFGYYKFNTEDIFTEINNGKKA